MVSLKSFGFSKKKGNAHVVLSSACPTSELKDYSDKPLKKKSVQKLKKQRVMKKKSYERKLLLQKLSTDEES